MSMNKRAVLITGCSSGIGEHAALVLQKRGYRVFASARRTSDVDRLRDHGLESLQLDLDDDTSIAAAVDEVLTHTSGRLYALFNNGAYGQTGAVEDLSRAVLRAQLETNLLGWHELTRRVIPAMRAQGDQSQYRTVLYNAPLAVSAHGRYYAARELVPSQQVGFKLRPQHGARKVFHRASLAISAVVEQGVQATGRSRQHLVDGRRDARVVVQVEL